MNYMYMYMKVHVHVHVHVQYFRREGEQLRETQWERGEAPHHVREEGGGPLRDGRARLWRGLQVRRLHSGRGGEGEGGGCRRPGDCWSNLVLFWVRTERERERERERECVCVSLHKISVKSVLMYMYMYIYIIHVYTAILVTYMYMYMYMYRCTCTCTCT